MSVYVALLRGINVGGKNIIKMAELRQVFEKVGFSEVQTYIQSGNVLFKSNEEEELLRKIIEHEIESSFGFSITVTLRTSAALERIISNCPFSKEEIAEAESSSDVESLYVAMLPHAPLQEKIDLLNVYRSENDQCKIVERDVYLLFHNSIRNSKLANNLHKLEIPATVRNWKTMSKIVALAKAMET